MEGYSRENLAAWIEDSLRNLATDTLDLLQLHCPPTEVYYRPEVFGMLDDLVAAGKIRYYGVSVEKVEEALKAIEYPNVQTVQIIFNCFRQRPAEVFFAKAKQKQVGILARVPLASGLLTGKLAPRFEFAADDHRNFNRHGEAVRRGRDIFRRGLRNWSRSGGGDSGRVGAGRSDDEPVRAALDSDVRCGDLRHSRRQTPRPGGGKLRVRLSFRRFTPEAMAAVRRIYDERIRPLVQHRW